MLINAPGFGEFNTCLDDSCDGSHCVICGGHFVDFYQTHTLACDTCAQLDGPAQAAVSAARDQAWKNEYGSQTEALPPWEAH